MKKQISLVLSLVMVIAFCLIAFSNVAPHADAKETTIGEDQEELRRLTKELESIKQKRDESKKAARDAQKQYAGTEKEMDIIQSEIDELTLEQNQTEMIIAGYESVIQRLKDSIGEQTVRINDLYELYDNILINYYKYGKPSDLELMASSGSLSEYLTKKDYVGYILESMKQKELEIEAATTDLENTYAEITKSYKYLDQYNEDIRNMLDEQQLLLEELNTKLGEYVSDVTLSEKEAQNYADRQAALQKKIDALNKQIEEKKAYIDPSFCWPIDSVYWKNCYISSGYGTRRDPFTGELRTHKGVDIAAPYGTPVQVVKSGVVVESTDHGGSAGIWIKVQHYDGSYTSYHHLSKRLVNVGAKVIQGQIIGKVGSTGRSTGNHLHFQVYEGSEVVNPKKYLDKYILKALDIHHYFD